MRTSVALLVLLAMPAAWALGPAEVVRPLGGDTPLPPEPVTTLGPAEDVSSVEPLGRLPSEAELQASAEAEAEAKRPPPLQPKRIPQAVEDLGAGRFLFVPKQDVTGLDGPLRTNGTLSGQMFRDETEVLRPVEAPRMETEPTFAEDMQTVREELQSIKSGLTDIVSRVATPTVPVPETPTVSMPAVAAVASPSVPKPVTPKAQPSVAYPTLSLTYVADDAEATNTTKLKTWAARIGQGRTLNLQVITRTQAPPLGSTAADIAATRWRKVRETLTAQGVSVGRVSFIYLAEASQGLEVKVVK